MCIRGILFDFDGTLADTNELIFSSFAYAFQTVLGKVPSRTDIVKTFGLTLDEALEQLAPPDQQERLRRIYKDYQNERHDQMIRPFSAAETTLVNLRRQGIKLGVFSSKKRSMLERGLRCINLDSYIDAIVAAGEATKSKPAAEPVLLLCERLNVKPANTLCVGDSYHDINCGHAAGALTVAVRYTEMDWQELLRQGGPDYSIENLAELIDLTAKLNNKAV